jgi:hypothetical protein
VRPLVRYANGDVVRVVAARCGCGKPFRIVEYAGRMNDLLIGRDGRAITYGELDAAVGAPPGVELFQLSVSPRRGVLAVTPRSAGGLVDTRALRDRIAATLGRPATIRFADSLDVPDGGKLLALRTSDQTAHWHRRFLG